MGAPDTFLALIGAAHDRAGGQRADRLIAPAGGNADDVLDIAWRGQRCPFSVGAGDLEPADVVHPVDVVADGHDQKAAAALFTRRSPVIGRVAARAHPVTAIL